MNALILNTPIREIPTSQEFQEMALQNQLDSLGIILNYRADELTKLPKFNLHMLDELIQILKRYGLLEMLKED
jgi:hypothetical protein